MNPLVPSAFEVTVQVLGVLHLILLVAAAIAVLRSKVFSAGSRAFLLVIAVVVPLIGPVLTLFMCRVPRPNVRRR